MKPRLLPARNSDLIVYPAAQMTGVPDYNFPWFRYVTDTLRSRGYTVMPPHEVNHGGIVGVNPEYEYEDYLRDDIRQALVYCNAVLLGPGWTRSRGAVAELNFAANTGYFIFFWDQSREEMIRTDQWQGAPDSGAAQEGHVLRQVWGLPGDRFDVDFRDITGAGYRA